MQMNKKDQTWVVNTVWSFDNSERSHDLGVQGVQAIPPLKPQNVSLD